MPASRNATRCSERPTLPSIHALNLPSISRSPPHNVQYDSYDNMKRGVPVFHARRVSTSSSQTSCSSRNSSPTPSSPSEMVSARTPTSPKKFRLAPCALEDAEAIIYVFPRRHSLDIQAGSNIVSQSATETGMLITGASVEKFRRSYRPTDKNCKVYPYRIVDHRSTESRRSSIISVSAFSFS